jgi:serine/threonine-protein kinase
LLAYLAAAEPRGAHRRDALVGLFWPDLDQDGARSALRQALHAIRRSLGAEAISSDGAAAVAVCPAAFRCDLWEFENAVARGDHAEAVRLYSGDVCAGLHVTDAPEFERWIDAARMRARTMARASAWAAAEHAKGERRTDDVARHAQFAVSLSEFDDAAARRAMTLLAGVGQRAGAVALYERFAAGLTRELDVAPDAETLALAAELRRTAPDRARKPIVAAMSSPARAASVDAVALRSVIEMPDTQHAPRAQNGRRARRALVAVALGGVVLLTAAQLAPARSAALDPRQIRVEAFTSNGATALDSMAGMATTEARAGLMTLDNVRVAASLPAANAARIDGGKDRAGTLVRGFVQLAGDSAEMHAEVVDRSTNVILRAVSVRVARSAMTASGSAVLLAAFTERLRTAVATALYPGWGTALSQPLSYESYRAFVDGMRWIKREEPESALVAFQRALTADRSFTAAQLLAAMQNYQLKRFASADTLVQRVAAHRASLRPVDANLLDWTVRSLHGDRIGARAAMEAATALAPGADLAWLQLAIDNVETARPREALAALDHIDPASDFGEGWLSYWATRLEALHIMGDHHRELAVARDALRRHPNLRLLANYELRALAALGRTDEVNDALAAVAGVPANDALDVPMTMRQVGLEFAAHGYATAAAQVFRLTVAWYQARPADERATAKWVLGYARTLYFADDRRGARAVYDYVLRAHPTCADCAGVVGVLAARVADTLAVRRSLAVLTSAPVAFSFGRNLVWRSRIAATLGDSAGATALLTAAFAAGTEFDVMTHADGDLTRINPDAVYRRFAHIDR